MNMKKTIAAVAACAMAVSAMATTVSAVDENATQGASWNYSLTLKKEIKEKTADLTFVGKGITTAATKYELYVPKSVVKSLSTDATVTVTDRSTRTPYSFIFSSDPKSPNYDGTTTVAEKDLFNTTGATPALGTDGTNDTIVYTIDLTSGTGAALKAAFDGAANSGVDFIFAMKGVSVNDGIDQEKLNTALVAGKPVTSAANLVNGAIALVDNGTTPNLYNAKGAVTESKYTVTKPMKTTPNTKSAGTSEIFSLLATKGSKDTGSAYVNAQAVINDMIANYDDVVFTFNTATDNVFTKAYFEANTNTGDWTGNNAALTAYTDYYVTGVKGAESWMGDDQYKAFPQHLYNLYGDESTKFTYTDSYVFNNLFNAALVANNDYTMNQSTITPFEYSKTSVSFSWSELTGGNAFVTVASALKSLQLATSSDWYWDSMDVTGYTLAAEDASTDAGIEDDGADLDDDAADDTADDDTVADDDVADDDAAADDVADDDVAADDTVADDTTADANPATGNAPIALAVIPVALAAAAVVAKKRG